MSGGSYPDWTGFGWEVEEIDWSAGWPNNPKIIYPQPPKQSKIPDTVPPNPNSFPKHRNEIKTMKIPLSASFDMKGKIME